MRFSCDIFIIAIICMKRDTFNRLKEADAT